MKDCYTQAYWIYSVFLTFAEGPFEEILPLLKFTVWPISAADSGKQED